MNTGKQINAMVVILFILLVALGAYTVFEPFRAEQAEEDQIDIAADRGAETFALNCRLCHGDRGQGGVEGGRFAGAPVLDKPDLQGIDQGTFSQAEFENDFDFVFNTIMCGRVGARMPAWGENQGGTLNDEQVRQLAVLITRARWDLAQEHADEIDAEATGHAEVDMPEGSFGPDETELIVSDARDFSLGQYIRIKVDEETEERLRVLPRQVVIERAVDGTEADDHDAGVEILRPGEAEPVQSLAEDLDEEAGAMVVIDPDAFEAGETLVIEDERVEVVGIEQGIPTTGQVLAEDIGREPEQFLISGSENIEVGQNVRLEGELLEVLEVRDGGETGIALDADVVSSDDEVSVSRPTFFSEGYTFRVGDEWIEVIAPVETGQVLFNGIGRANKTLFLTGTDGIEPGLVIRAGDELMRVEEIVEPASIEVERAVEDTAESHDAGAEILEVVPAEQAAEGEEPTGEAELVPTGQAVLEGIGTDETTIRVGGTSGITLNGMVQIGDEIMHVTDIVPAEVRVERAAGEADEQTHPRRAPLYVGNLLEVERGVRGTSAADHGTGDEIFMTELEVERSVEGSDLQAHTQNVELFIGNGLFVERGVFNTEPVEHENGRLVRNFPTAPDDPAINEGACGQLPAPEGEAPTGPEPTPIEGSDVEISLVEWDVIPDPENIPADGANFEVTNDGTVGHNFRVLRTDLAPDALPQENSVVVEDDPEIEVVGGFEATIDPDAELLSPVESLQAGNYVLICNVPQHYDNGMFVGFEVTP